MNQALDRQHQVIEEFARLKRRSRNYIGLLCFLLLAWIIVAAAFTGRDGVSLWGMPLAWAIEGGLILAAAIGTAFSLRYWRCPACNRYLGGALFMRHCPRCGARLTR